MGKRKIVKQSVVESAVGKRKETEKQKEEEEAEEEDNISIQYPTTIKSIG